MALWRTHLSKPPWSRRSSRSTWRDIQQLNGLNLQGTRKAIYLNEIDGVRRGRSDAVLHGDLAGGAHDASHPELDGWYEKLESGKGPCCDGSEAAHVEPSDWETQNKPRSHYKVRLDGVWADVPDEAVVTGPNRDGRTLVWYYDSWTGHSGIPGKVIKCFMPGTMT